MTLRKRIGHWFGFHTASNLLSADEVVFGFYYFRFQCSCGAKWKTSFRSNNLGATEFLRGIVHGFNSKSSDAAERTEGKGV